MTVISPNTLKKLKNEARNPKSSKTAHTERQQILHLTGNHYTPFQKRVLKSLRPYIRDGRYMDQKTTDKMRTVLAGVMQEGSTRNVIEMLRLADNIHRSAVIRSARNDRDRMTRRQNTGHVTARKFAADRGKVFSESFYEIRNLNRAGAYNRT